MDDFGLQSLPVQWAQDLYEIINERYERHSITSNRSLEERGEVFGNALLASAGLDHLTHYAHILVSRGQNYRQLSRGVVHMRAAIDTEVERMRGEGEPNTYRRVLCWSI